VVNPLRIAAKKSQFSSKCMDLSATVLDREADRS